MTGMVIGFDIDGTVADLTHRRGFVRTKPKNWGAFYGAMDRDTPIAPIISVANAMRDARHLIFFASGREGTERHRAKTADWLVAHVGTWTAHVPLWMRKAGDYRADDIVKEEILDEFVIPFFGRVPDIIFDDRDRVVKMWRRRGIICAQVAEGDF